MPTIITTQWSRKLGLPDKTVSQGCVFRYQGEHRRGVLLTHELADTKMEAAGTVDFEKYAPIVIYPDNNNEILSLWACG